MKLHALLSLAILTAAYAVVYVAFGWLWMQVVPHYYTLARESEEDNRDATVSAWLLRAMLLTVLVGWTAEMAATTRVVLHGAPLWLAIVSVPLSYVVVVACVLLVVWLAYVLGSEFGGLRPETLVVIAMAAYTLFLAVPRLTAAIVWMPRTMR